MFIISLVNLLLIDYSIYYIHFEISGKNHGILCDTKPSCQNNTGWSIFETLNCAEDFSLGMKDLEGL